MDGLPPSYCPQAPRSTHGEYATCDIASTVYTTFSIRRVGCEARVQHTKRARAAALCVLVRWRSLSSLPACGRAVRPAAVRRRLMVGHQARGGSHHATSPGSVQATCSETRGSQCGTRRTCWRMPKQLGHRTSTVNGALPRAPMPVIFTTHARPQVRPCRHPESVAMHSRQNEPCPKTP